MLIVERSCVPQRTWPDEYIEQWGDYYRAHPEILARGVRFETFLYAPAPILRALGMPQGTVEHLAIGMLETANRLRLALERAGANCSNGALIEKLRHNRIQRTRHRRRDIDGRLV